MTSFIISSHVARKQHSSWVQDGCTFCKILANELPSSRVFENDKVVAFLDIMPLRPGHTLVVPKIHCSRLSELPSEYAAAVGEAVSKVAHALTKALDNTALNVVCNQEYAQAVPHVHYHIIPAPQFEKTIEAPTRVVVKDGGPSVPLTVQQMHQMEFESRSDLDEDDAQLLVKQIRAHL
ncbi:histidine triad protein [Moniliophthora roreri MCA 2997]|uniref:Histidine triad protein n=1 Tax=Moniliophthora roreri (strain MCA 2997) TaxID=1381753 RepID=V2WXP2_MONRO|nr:histidine triad protein [Moniliophthora roreri MCA 2997]